MSSLKLNSEASYHRLRVARSSALFFRGSSICHRCHSLLCNHGTYFPELASTESGPVWHKSFEHTAVADSRTFPRDVLAVNKCNTYQSKNSAGSPCDCDSVNLRSTVKTRVVTFASFCFFCVDDGRLSFAGLCCSLQWSRIFVTSASPPCAGRVVATACFLCRSLNIHFVLHARLRRPTFESIENVPRV